MDEPLPAASLRGPKISKACEECRRRKQKCNGLSPCNVCSRRNTVCSYRSFIRRRIGRSSTNPAPPPKDQPAQPLPKPEEEEDHDHSADRESSNADSSAFSEAPPRYHIYKNIRATHVPADSPSCVLQLYYGSSSNFSFLQHLHTHLTAHEEVPRPGAHVEEVQNGNESIDVYKYQGLAFGNAPGQRETNPMFLRHDLARTFLQNYLSTAHLHLPFLSAEQLCLNFEKLYGYGDDAKIDPSERALVIVVMAIGACPTQHDLWRKTLLAQARTEAESLLHVVHIRAVQIALLMAYCEFNVGNPNSSYLYLGSAIRKAFAAGMHRGSPTSRQSLKECSEASRTCWSLFCLESLICSGLGRPASLSLEDVGLAQPERPSFMSAQVTVSELLRSVQHLYNHHDSSVSADLKSAHRIRNRLRSFAQTAKDDLGFTIGSHLGTERDEKFVTRAVISYLYHYTLLLAFRPFLLLFVELKRRAEFEGKDSGSKSNPFNIPPLLEACEYTVDAARSIVLLGEIVFGTGPGAEGICNNCFFLESACFVLILAALHDRNATRRHIRYINRGIRALRHITPREPITSIIAAIDQMRCKVEVLTGLTDNLDSAGAGLPGGPVPNRTQQHGFAPQEAAMLNASASGAVPGTDPAQPDLETPPGFGSFEQSAPSVASDVLDATWPSMDWNFDLSNLDLESFVSVMGNQQEGNFGLF
ncbi:fungal-specific transcription factor domain-containing protein [Macrophomina phaseolina]|uniref:Fungal-specific transcription factor domain-containing protein n=1 Tax=Macrophomina phaseolina TaxID=35725 RepID=A0ABQ8GMS8_9PEZI|nr:fungal-specific transcription factor domain-containing protein [Macrophomina phaseolina]